METPITQEMYDQIKHELANEKQKNEFLKTLAMKDTLTGIDNRGSLNEKLTQQLAESRRSNSKLIVIMFDIDDFKSVNDKYGHKRGDQILIRLAQVVTETKRPEDILGRYGGEEFTLIFPEQASADLSHFNMDRFQEAISKINRSPNGDAENITVSFGAVVVDFSKEDYKNQDTSINEESLLEEADSQLYASKKAGKNRLTISYRTAE